MQCVKHYFSANSDYSYNYMTSIFDFPYSNTKDYVKMLENSINEKTTWVSTGGINGRGLYNCILKNELYVFDNKIPTNINEQYNGVYVLADKEGKVLYVGKCHSKGIHLVSRFLDHVVLPRSSLRYMDGQPMNNDDSFWYYLKYKSFFKSNVKLRCFLCFSANINPAALERELQRCAGIQPNF